MVAEAGGSRVVATMVEDRWTPSGGAGGLVATEELEVMFHRLLPQTEIVMAEPMVILVLNSTSTMLSALSILCYLL